MLSEFAVAQKELVCLCYCLPVVFAALDHRLHAAIPFGMKMPTRLCPKGARRAKTMRLSAAQNCVLEQRPKIVEAWNKSTLFGRSCARGCDKRVIAIR